MLETGDLYETARFEDEIERVFVRSHEIAIPADSPSAHGLRLRDQTAAKYDGRN